MHDVLLDLEWIIEGGSRAGVPTPVARERRSRERLAWSLVALFGVVALVAVGWHFSTRPDPPRRVTTTILPRESDGETLLPHVRFLALSPDGSRLVFVGHSEGGGSRLYLRDLERDATRVVDGTEGGEFPFWSPDGASLGFFADEKLKRIDVDGGSPLALADAPDGIGGTWGPDDTIVFSADSRSRLTRISSRGGPAEPIGGTGRQADAEPSDDEGAEKDAPFALGFPVMLPGGERFLYTYLSPDRSLNAIRAGSLDGEFDEEVLGVVSSAGFADGHLFYVVDGTLVAQPFDPVGLELTGPARTLAEGVASDWAFADFSVVPGALAFTNARPERDRQLAWYDRDGTRTELIAEGIPIDDMNLSRDGRFLALARIQDDADRGIDVWTLDLAREVLTRLTFSELADDPVWSPDGRSIAYAENGQIHRKRSSGVGKPDALYESGVDKVLQDWSRDGKQIFFLANGPHEDIWVLEMHGDEPGEARAVLESPFREIHAQLSPDGRWLAYASNESGVLQVYVVSWPDLELRWQISKDGGSMPRWRKDGHEIYFMSPARELMAVDVTPGETEFLIGSTTTLFASRMGSSFEIRTHGYASSADGTRFLIGEAVEIDAESIPTLTLIQNPLAGRLDR